MSENIAASSASSATKSFFGGITGTLGVVVGLILVLCLCCGGLAFFASMSKDKNEPTKVNESNTGTTNNTESGNDSTLSEFKVGDQVKLGDITFTVNESIDNYLSDNQFERPSAGNKFIAVDVKIDNNGNGSEYIYLSNFNIQDASAYKYEAKWYEIKAPGLKSGDIAKGSSLRGWVTFEVPNDATGLKLSFSPGFWSSKEIKVKL